LTTGHCHNSSALRERGKQRTSNSRKLIFLFTPQRYNKKTNKKIIYKNYFKTFLFCGNL
jgi:hypothetical protein